MKKIAIFLSFIIITNANAQKAATLEFDGIDDYVDLGVVEGIEFTGNDFSIQVWVKTTSTKAQSIFVKGDGDEDWEEGEKLYILRTLAILGLSVLIMNISQEQD